MGHVVEDPTYDLHAENRFYPGTLIRVEYEDEGRFGPQIKWIIALDDDDPWIDDHGEEQPRETWFWCSQRLTTHEKNKFRQIVKGLTGAEPKTGQLFEEEHYTSQYYKENPDADPEALTGSKEPWRVSVMFEHGKKGDGSPTDKVQRIVRTDLIS